MVSLPFTLNSEFVPQVKKDDIVKVGTVLATKAITGDEKISLSVALSLPSRLVGKYVKVNPGDQVKVGDALAIKKTFLREDKVLSEVEGTVTGFERDTGTLLIRPHNIPTSSQVEELLSPIDGIVSVCNNGQIVVQTEKDVLLGEMGVGGSAEAELLQIENSGDEGQALLYVLDARIIGKIVLFESCDRDALLKTIGMGAEGVVAKNISDTDMQYLLQRNITTPVIVINEENYKKIGKWRDKKVFLDGMNKTVVLLHV